MMAALTRTVTITWFLLLLIIITNHYGYLIVKYNIFSFHFIIIINHYGCLNVKYNTFHFIFFLPSVSLFSKSEDDVSHESSSSPPESSSDDEEDKIHRLIGCLDPKCDVLLIAESKLSKTLIVIS